MFEVPNFSVGGTVFTALGAIVFWAKWGRSKRLEAVMLRPLFENIFGWSGRLRDGAELVAFVVLGCVLVQALLEPTTATQAFAFGCSWTGIISTPKA